MPSSSMLGGVSAFALIAIARRLSRRRRVGK
jgi:hypothetical protein